MTVTRRGALHVALPLVLGLALTVAWRSREVHVVAFINRLAPRGVGVVQGAGAARAPALIIGSLPDALWAWSFGAMMGIVWLGKPWRAKRAWLGMGALVALSAELGQAAHLVPGTYDVADLVAIAAGYVLGAALTSRPRGSPRPAPR